MDEFAIAAYLGRTAVAGAAVLALGRAALTLARSPATRQRLAAGTLRAAALVPLLALLPSWWVVTVPATPPAVVEAVAVEPTPVPAETPALPVEWVTAPEFVEVEAPAFDEVEPTSVAVEPEPVVVVVAPPGRTWRDAVAVAAAVYAAGVAYFLGVFALGHLALVRLRRGATLAPNRVRAVWGSRRPPALLIHEVLASPVCFGVVRPAVVLPAALAKAATGQQLAWVLAHEADHLRRGDPLTGWFAGFAKALFFFAPWYWGVRRELRLAQEYLADAAALAAGGHAADYAEFLVDLTAAPVRGRRILLAHGVRAGRSDLSRRITMVLSTTPPRATKRWAAPAAAGLFAVAVALSGVTIVRADDKPKPAEAAPQPPDAPKPRQVQLRIEVTQSADKPAEAAKPADVNRLGVGKLLVEHPGNVWQIQSSDVPLRVDVEKLRKQIDEDLAAGKTDRAKKLIDALVKALTQSVPVPVPVPPTPPVAPKPPLPPAAPLPPGSPTPPAAPTLQGGTIQGMGIRTDPRLTAAVEALGKAMETTKDAEARAAMVQAIKLMREHQRLTVTRLGDATGGEGGGGGRGGAANGLPGAGGFAPLAGFAPGAAFGSRPQTPDNFGLTVAPLSEALAEQLQLPARTGLLVTAVQPDSPFAKVGVKKNDVLPSVGFTQLSTGGVQLQVEPVKGKLTVVVISKGVKQVVVVEVPEPTVRLTRPVVKKVRFESMKMEVFNGGVSIEAKKGDRQYKITGAQVGELLDHSEITITDLKTGKSTLQSGTVLSEMGEDDRAAVQTLLDQIRGR